MVLSRDERFLRVFIALFFTSWLLQDQIAKIFPLWGYLDELIALSAFPGLVVYGLRKRFSMVQYWTVSIALCYLVTGIGFGVMYAFQPVKVILYQALISTKFIWVVFLFFTIETCWGISRLITPRVVVSVAALFTLFFCAMEFALQDYMLSKWRVCANCVFLIAGIIVFCRKRREQIAWIVLLLIIMVSTGKGTAYGGAALIVFLYIWMFYLKKEVRLRYLIFAVLIVFAAGWQDFSYYYIDGIKYNYARAMMMMSSLKIARDYFPMGTGFGTFGSYMAGKYYSPLYYIYGLSKHHELGVQNQMYMYDNGVAPILAENGIMGTLLVSLLLFFLYGAIQKIGHNDRRRAMALFSVIGYIVISMIAETGFAQPVVIPCAALTGILLAMKRKGSK